MRFRAIPLQPRRFESHEPSPAAATAAMFVSCYAPCAPPATKHSSLCSFEVEARGKSSPSTRGKLEFSTGECYLDADSILWGRTIARCMAMTWGKRRALIIGTVIFLLALLIWAASKPARLGSNSVLVLDA